MEMYQFIKGTKPAHLTIADIKKLNVGDKLDVVIWDRNFEEYWIWDFAESDKHYDPEELFDYNHHQITYLGDMNWELNLNFGKKCDKMNVIHPIHLDTSELETKYMWYPLDITDGKIHITNEIIKDGEKIPDKWKPKHIHWSEFPDTTRVGWRGPIMLWDKLKDMSKVYYKNGVYN